MGILIGAVVLMLGYGGAYVASEDVRYLTRAGLEQIEILRKRRPIQSLVDDAALDPSTRALLRLVLDAREYAADLGLEAGDTYKQFTDVGRDTAVRMVLHGQLAVGLLDLVG
jgi:predicted aminopeptidase